MTILSNLIVRSFPHAGVLAALTFLTLTRMQREQTQVIKKPAPETPPQLFEGVKWLQPDDTGVSYRELFGQYLNSSSSISIVDPWLKSFRQIRLLGEFLECVASESREGERVTITLTTSLANETDGWAMGQVKALLDMKEKFSPRGIDLSVKFDESIHDRWMQTEKWTILLGKGLDIWESSSCYRLPQLERPISKQTAITYIGASADPTTTAHPSRKAAR